MNDSRSGFGSLHMPRSRGAVSGLLLMVLGVWGALIPFIGPYFHFAYSPDQVWVWSTARAWLEVFPGVTTAVGGFLLLVSGNRVTAMFGSWLAVIAGAWFVVGRTLASLLRLGDIGHPIAVTDAKRAVLEISYFAGLGALIVFLGGVVLARVTTRTLRDVQFASEFEPEPAGAPEYPGLVEAPAPPTEVLASNTHRREDKGGIFRRRSAGATSH
jgi:hypothetical protein